MSVFEDFARGKVAMAQADLISNVAAAVGSLMDQVAKVQLDEKDASECAKIMVASASAAAGTTINTRS